MDLMWVAVYQDESIQEQYEEGGQENKYSDIDRKNLSEFHLVDRETGRTVYAIALDDGQRLIYRMRHMTRGDGVDIATICMVGWQENVNGRNVQSIGWIFPDGSIIQTGKFRENHRLFYGVEFMEFEKINVEKEFDVEREPV